LTQSVIVFLKTLMEQLDKAGAREVIDTFTEALDRLTFFLSTPLGQKGLEGLINLAIISIKVLTGLMVLILLVLAAFQYAAEAISAFFTWVWDGIQSLWDKIIGLFTDADDQIIAALGNVDTMLFNVGARIIKGLIAGIRSMVPSLGGVMTIIASTITRYLPHSPAEEGPLSGSGDLMVAGKNIIDRLSAGITAGSQELGVAMTGATNNIVFGANAIQVGFNGALPTEAQAMQTGMAVGQGALSILARNTRLAVRTA
jgi:hypothetical protein